MTVGAIMAGDVTRRRVLLALVLMTVGLPASAQMADPSSDRLPTQLGDVGIEQKLGEQVPLQLPFRDETGKIVALGEYFQSGRPVILSLVYFNCQMLCSQVLAEMAHTLRRLKFDAGKQFEIVTVSFDPRETPQMAAAAKSKYLAMYGRPGSESGWRFLTGEQPSIIALSNAVGFHYSWDSRTKQFAHATGIMLLTPQGRVAQYYYGARYFPSDLRLGLIEASHNRIGTLADQIVLYCYHYDPRTGRYGAIVFRVMQVSGGFTLLTLGSLVVFLFFSDPNRRRRYSSDTYLNEHSLVTTRFRQEQPQQTSEKGA
jgi:protein SCO1